MDQIADYAIYNHPPYLMQWLAGIDIGKMAAAFDRQFNDLETTVFDFLNKFGIDVATGDQLDIIGSWLSVPRALREDENYRTLLRLKAHLNQSTGTPEDMIQVIKTLYQAVNVHYIPDFPAKIIMEHDGTDGLHQSFDLVFDDGSFAVTMAGDQLIVTQGDAVLDNLVEESAPAGVGLTVNQI